MAWINICNTAGRVIVVGKRPSVGTGGAKAMMRFFYGQPCVDALGGPPYNPSAPLPASARRALVVAKRRARRLACFLRRH